MSNTQAMEMGRVNKRNNQIDRPPRKYHKRHFMALINIETGLKIPTVQNRCSQILKSSGNTTLLDTGMLNTFLSQQVQNTYFSVNVTKISTHAL